MTTQPGPLLGFDVGATTARGVAYRAIPAAGDWGEPAAAAKQTIRGITDPDRLAAELVSMAEEILGGLEGDRASLSEVAGVGVALAAQLDHAGRNVRNSPNLGWRDVAFRQILSKRWSDAADVDEAFGDGGIVLANDVDAVLNGEHRAGAVAEAWNAVAVMVGSGVGGGVLVGGDVYRGAANAAGEIGHNKVVPGGRRCGCGQRGCVEAYAGGVHLERRVRELVDDGAYEASEFDGDDAVEASGISLARADEVAGLELDDDRVGGTGTDDRVGGTDGSEVPTVGDIWREATDYLAVVVANVCTTLNPEVLLLGGGVLESLPIYRREFLSKMSPLVGSVQADDLEVAWPTLGDWSGAIGAAQFAVAESGS